MNLSEMKTHPAKIRRCVNERRIYYICPACGKPLVFRKTQNSVQKCSRCGQKLDWYDYAEMPGVYVTVHNSTDAGYWAAQYEAINGDTYGIDVEEWRLIQKAYPLELYFPFLDKKAYGRFMRMATKERNRPEQA